MIWTSIYRKLFLHIGHHCIISLYFANFRRSPVLPVDVMLGCFDRERNGGTIPQNMYIKEVGKH